MAVQVYQCIKIHPKSDNAENIHTFLTTHMATVVSWLTNESTAERIYLVYKFPEMKLLTKAEVILT